MTEILPIFSRLELENTVWVPRHWPPNLGAERDLPDNAVLHRSVYSLYRARVLEKLPKLGGNGPPRLPKLSRAFFSLDLFSGDDVAEETNEGKE